MRLRPAETTDGPGTAGRQLRRWLLGGWLVLVVGGWTLTQTLDAGIRPTNGPSPSTTARPTLPAYSYPTSAAGVTATTGPTDTTADVDEDHCPQSRPTPLRDGHTHSKILCVTFMTR
ncbi:hypothetical protein G3I19_03560 [Streptomyces sp. SID10853]|uniref:hypothetical protein n=1 Tax=Streptomyces sp. SID10853 TaxID=2706028 RepID=UPI0013BFFC3F|nr:hypothetical protein [Streptomyces sp. SID10853]NDZ77615.1 hypothetical protein [Streptomyces sp. SID10853]